MALDAQTATGLGHCQLSYDWEREQAVLCRVLMAPSARGQGLGGELVRFAVEQAFGSDGIYRLELRVFDFNNAAIRLYEGVGFVKEGLLRKSAPFREERWDTLVMSILRTEYSASCE
jgi:RimJ/RimL family protein N-acetyltransferase